MAFGHAAAHPTLSLHTARSSPTMHAKKSTGIEVTKKEADTGRPTTLPSLHASYAPTAGTSGPSTSHSGSLNGAPLPIEPTSLRTLVPDFVLPSPGQCTGAAPRSGASPRARQRRPSAAAALSKSLRQRLAASPSPPPQGSDTTATAPQPLPPQSLPPHNAAAAAATTTTAAPTPVAPTTTPAEPPAPPKPPTVQRSTSRGTSASLRLQTQAGAPTPGASQTGTPSSSNGAAANGAPHSVPPAATSGSAQPHLTAAQGENGQSPPPHNVQQGQQQGQQPGPTQQQPAVSSSGGNGRNGSGPQTVPRVQLAGARKRAARQRSISRV